MALPPLLRPPTIRSPETEKERHSTWLETFSDLIFVTAIAALSSLAFKEFSGQGMLHFGVLFIPVWWCWVGTTFYSTRFDTDDLVQRLFTMTQMGAVAGMALFIPYGMGDGSKGFALCYVMFRVLLILQYLRAGHALPRARPLIRGYTSGFALAALMWCASLWVPIPYRFAVWFLAIAVDLVTPSLYVKEAIEIPPHLAHIPERFGLFTVIVMGEAVAATVVGTSAAHLAPEAFGTAALGLVFAFALWWDYFDGARASVDRKMDLGKSARRFRAWMYLHLPLTGLITLLASGIRIAISQPSGVSLTSEQGWVLCVSTSVTMYILMLIWVTAPDVNVPYSHMWAKLARYGVVSSIPLLLGAFSDRMPPVALVGALAAVFIVRVAMSAHDNRREGIFRSDPSDS